MAKYKRSFKRKFIKRDNSRSTVTTTKWNAISGNIYPDFELVKCLQMVRNDPALNGAINRFVSKCMEGDINFYKKDTEEYDEVTERKLQEKYMFRTKILREIFYNVVLYNSSFIEIVRKTNNEVKDMNVLYTPYMQPQVALNGDPQRYKWMLIDVDKGDFPRWDTKNIVWVKYNDAGIGYPLVRLKSLWDLLLLKSYVLRFTTWLWQTGQYKSVFNFETGGKNIEDFLTYTRKASQQYEMPYISKGKFNFGVLRDLKETDSVQKLLSYIDIQMLMVIGLPPNDAGMPDSSGRSNADAQSNILVTNVNDVKKVVEDYVNYELFPKINKNNTLMKFAPADRFFVKSAWETVNKMAAVNVKEEVMEKYLRDNGVITSKDIFKKLDLVGQDTPKDASGNPLNSEVKKEMPSRQGKDTGEGNINQDEVTTRENQIKRDA